MTHCRTSRRLGSHAAVGSIAAFVSPGLCTMLMAAPAPLPAGDLSMWRANTFTFSGQGEAAISIDDRADDEMTVVWSSRRQQHGRSAVCLQRFTHQGVAIGGETPVSLWKPGAAIAPAISSAAGATWVAWQAHGQDGQGASIVARVFERTPDPNAGDVMLGSSEVLVNERWLGDQTSPVVAASDDGSALVVWVSRHGPRGTSHLAARLLDRSGRPLGDEFDLTSAADAASAAVPSVCRTADGTFAVAYACTDDNQRPARIVLQRIGRCGEMLGAPATVSQKPELEPVEPTVAATSEGLVVAWVEHRVGDGVERVVARGINDEGTPRGASFEVDSVQSARQTGASVAGSPDGRFAVAWNQSGASEGAGDDDAGSHIRARWFDTHGNAQGDSVQLSAVDSKTHAMATASGTNHLTVLADGSLVCAWHGDSGQGDSSAANVSMLAASPLDLQGERQGIVDDQKAPPAMQVAMSSDADTAGRPEPHVPPSFDPRQIDKGEREIVLGITDIGFTAILSTGWTPPDPSLAAGPNHLVVMTNGAIAWFTKDGTLQFQIDINGVAGFWGSLTPTGFSFDPEVLYDDTTGRFFAMCSEGQAAPGGTKSFLLLAVSDDSDPNGTWYKYRFDTTALSGSIFDSPNMAVDATTVYITGDGPGNYPVYTYDKASLLAGLPPAISKSTTLPTSTQSAGIPPIAYDNPPALYMVEHDESAPVNSVRMIALTNPLTTPTFTTFTLPIAAYSAPEDPPQSGTTVRPETFDSRFWSVAYRNGSLWACHHQGSTRVLARWYQFAMNGWPTSGQNPALVQTGTIDPGGTVRTFFPAITVDAANNATIVFARSSPTEFISMYTAHRDHTDPLGTLQTPIQRKINTAGYTTARWGDYGGIAVDPVDGRTIWAHHEYAIGASWRTWIAGFTPPTSCPADTALPYNGVVNIDDLLLVINNWDAVGLNPGDVTGNGVVNIDDLLAVINAWGPCP